MRWIVEGYQLYLEKGLKPTPIMETYLDEYRTNSDPIYQFVDSYIEETDENGFVPVQTMLDAIKDYCYRQGLNSPTEACT